jgi:xylulokinase
VGKYLIGIDIGTTGAKSAIFNLNGNMLANSYNEYTCDFPRPNWVEQDACFVVSEAFRACKDAINKSAINPKEIISVSVSSQRSCSIFIDKNGKMLRPMISWQDSRSCNEVEEIKLKITPEKFYKITGFPLSPTWMISKILWVRNNEPEIWDKIAKIIQLQDYTLKRMGAEGYFNDISDAGFSGLWDTNNLKWSEDILRIFNISKDLLSSPKVSGEKIAVISKQASRECGILEGTPVCVGAGDQNSAAVGAGIVYDGYLSVSIGTAGNANSFLDKPFRDPNGKAMVLNHAIKGKWAIEGHQAGAAGVFRWFRDEFATIEKAYAGLTNKDTYAMLDEMILKIPAGSKGLIFLPFFAGATAPRWNSYARGVLLGLTFSHNKYCIARAFLEGITLEMRDIIESMVASEVNIKNIRIMGGATKSDIWNQIQSDVYNKSVETLKITDAAVLGAAIMAGVGKHVFKDIREGVKAMVHVGKKYEPIKRNSQIYNEMYDIYCELYKSLDTSEIFSKISKIQDKI